MDMSLQSPSPLLSLLTWLVIAIVWSGPIGLIVLRRHLAHARGPALIAKGALVTLTTVTGPAALLMIGIVVAAAFEAATLLWTLLRSTW